MHCLLIDGHPGADRLSAHLLDLYAAALPAGTELTRIALRDLRFAPHALHDYAALPAAEPDLDRLWAAMIACDHLVLAFPMWWGAEPALVSDVLTRVLLPGRAFAYHRDDPWWDRLLSGRSADVLVTMDTPPAVLRWLWGFPIGRRLRRQVLGFVGFAPVRVLCFGPVRRGGAGRALPRWGARIARAAAHIPHPRGRRATTVPLADPAAGAIFPPKTHPAKEP